MREPNLEAVIAMWVTGETGKGLGLLAHESEIMLYIGPNQLASLRDCPEHLLSDK